MKKLLITLSLVLVVVFAGFGFVGCKKKTTTPAKSYVGTWKAEAGTAFSLSMDEQAYNAVLEQNQLTDISELAYASISAAVVSSFSSEEIDLIITQDGAGYLWQIDTDKHRENPYARITYTQNGDTMTNLKAIPFATLAEVKAAYLAKGYTEAQINEIGDDKLEEYIDYLENNKQTIDISATVSDNKIVANVTDIAKAATAAGFIYSVKELYRAYGDEMTEDEITAAATTLVNSIVNCITSATVTFTLAK